MESLLLALLFSCASTHQCSAYHSKVDNKYHIMICGPQLIAQTPLDLLKSDNVIITRSNTCKISEGFQPDLSA